MKKTLILISVLMVLSGCGKKEEVESVAQPVKESVSQAPVKAVATQEPAKETLSQQPVEEAVTPPVINPWVFSQNVDKVSGEKTALLRADLTDSAVPAVYIETKFICTNDNFSIVLTGFTNEKKQRVEIKTNRISSNDSNNATVLIAMRSGDTKFSEQFRKEKYKNQIQTTYLRKVYPDDPKAFFVFRTLDKYFLKNISLDGNLLIQVPTELGKPTIQVDFQNEKVKQFFKYCVPKNEW